METLPLYISVFFSLTALIAFWLFARLTNYNKTVIGVILAWTALQTGLSLTGFYTVTYTMPPRFMLLLLPPVLTIAVLFNTAGGRAFLDGLNIKKLILFHVVRVPIELVLFWLYVNKAVPELMTFEGRNFDILSGLSAPIVFYFAFAKNKVNKALLLAWNFGCLALLFNIVINALLAAPTPLQQFAFDQPNIAISYFPFVLLPACIVPFVLFAHLVAIRQLFSRQPAPIPNRILQA